MRPFAVVKLNEVSKSCEHTGKRPLDDDNHHVSYLNVAEKERKKEKGVLKILERLQQIPLQAKKRSIQVYLPPPLLHVANMP